MRILETCFYAPDLTAARAFYEGFLGLEVIAFDAARHMFLRVEGGVLILFNPDKTEIPDAGVPPHGSRGVGHGAFAAGPGELDHWRERLLSQGVEIVQDITWPNGARSFYFHDPAGNLLEFAEDTLWAPAAKGV